jgi:dihydropteroate synthase
MGLAPGARHWHHSTGSLDCSRGHVVGIVNATPDSFTDEGRHFGTAASVAHGLDLARQGASVIEVGGESLRFSARTEVSEEIARVVPVIRELVDAIRQPIAIDTFNPAVADAAIAAGASILNDPTGLRDPDMLRLAAASHVGIVLTHFFGDPKVRPMSFPHVDVPRAVIEWVQGTLERTDDAAIARARIVIDPGVGLGKSPEQDLDLLHRLHELRVLGRPIFVPISNKKVLGAVTGRLANERLAPNAAAVVWCRLRGASLFRAHDVGFLRDVLTMTEALISGAPERWHGVIK